MTGPGRSTGRIGGPSVAAAAIPWVGSESAESPPRVLAPTLDLREAEREAAIARVFDQSHAQLVRLAVLLGAGADAEDIVAEAFCQLYRRWPKLRSPDAAPAYVRGAVLNLVRMRWRHLQVVRRHHDRALRPSDDVSAENVVLEREDQRAVVTALEELAPRQREAIVLRYWMDLKEAEIAAAMGISCGAVKSHTARAMSALTRAMGEVR
ncbi:RNA polymerase sigma factor [Kribbella catacumbae]|uniref:RNA polymerase sigma factor n=1 Tax=Kribbella catacumbae TaxID=460086 RepID=UPI00036BE2B0|nr:sigma-70 family RNA polymerase sigma factor [Kribbella catacumbae]